MLALVLMGLKVMTPFWMLTTTYFNKQLLNLFQEYQFTYLKYIPLVSFILKKKIHLHCITKMFYYNYLELNAQFFCLFFNYSWHHFGCWHALTSTNSCWICFRRSSSSDLQLLYQQFWINKWSRYGMFCYCIFVSTLYLGQWMVF